MPEAGLAVTYPATPAARRQWVVSRRVARNAVEPDRPVAFFVERERINRGEVGLTATLFLTNRECPWKCVMCDLWRNTTHEVVASGAIPRQIEYALERLPAARVIKLYNSGSFFDHHAIPPGDYGRIAQACSGFDRVIVECHPRLIGPDTFRFHDLVNGKLEVAMGLETAHEAALAKLNKGFGLRHYAQACEVLREHGIRVRSFLLVHPPFIQEGEQETWMEQSIQTAFSFGSHVLSLIPTRSGNGAMEALHDQGEFAEPRLVHLETAVEFGMGLGKGTVLADLWDLERFSQCANCFSGRRARLERINLAQELEPRTQCADCGGSGRA